MNSIRVIAMGPTAREENLEARTIHLNRELASIRGKVEAFRAWLKANTKGNPIEGNLMAERSLAHFRTLLPEKGVS